MKTTKKLLVLLVAVLILSSVTMVAVFADELPLGSLSEAGALMSMIESSTTAADKIEAINQYDEYMATHTFPTDALSQLNYSIITENAAAAKLKYTQENIEKIKTSTGYLAMLDATKENVAIANLSTVVGMFENFYFDKTTDAYLTFEKEYEATIAATQVKYDALIEEYYTATFGEYEYPVSVIYDFEQDSAGSVKMLSHGNFTNADPLYFEYEYRSVDGEGAQGSAGYYYEKTTKRTGDPYAYPSGFSAGSYPGVVFEFDYYHVPGASLQLSRGTCTINGDSSGTTEYGTFTTTKYTSGRSSVYNGSKSYTPEGGVLVENSWNRIAIALVKETGEFKVYVNYKYIASFRWTQEGQASEFTPQYVRFKYTGEEMRLDNVTFYYGTQPRILDRFEKIDVEERFVLYSEVIADDTQSFENRDSAYSWMVQNLSNFYDEYMQEYVYGISDKTKAAVDLLLAFDYSGMKICDHMKTFADDEADYELRIERYDELTTYLSELDYVLYQIVDGVRVATPNTAVIGESRTEVIAAVEEYIAADRDGLWNQYLESNLAELEKIYKELLKIRDTTLDTISTRQSAIDRANNYITEVTEEKIAQGKKYSEITEALVSWQEKVNFDLAVKDVQSALTSFDNAPTYEAQKRWAERVESLLLYNDVSIFSDLTKLEELAEMQTAYEQMAVKMDETTRINNAKKIVISVNTLIDSVLSILNDEIKANAPEGEIPVLLTKDDISSSMILSLVVEQKAAYDAGEIEEMPLWNTVRSYSIIAARGVKESYDDTYEGVAEAIAFNEPIYAYYYDLIQLDHAAVLLEMLEKYEEAKTYVDRLGVCTYIENYIAVNEVDQTREDICAIVVRAREIRESLTAGEDGQPSDAELSYQQTLKENTLLFIAAVEEMKAAQDQGYVVLYDAWQTALSYYYFMEITSDEVKVAIEEYAVLEAQLLEWQTNSDAFISIVGSLSESEEITNAQLYSILAKAYAVKEYTNSTYSGMKEALSAYENAYNYYMSFAGSVNAEIQQTVDVAIAERMPYSALEVIANLFAQVIG